MPLIEPVWESPGIDLNFEMLCILRDDEDLRAVLWPREGDHKMKFNGIKKPKTNAYEKLARAIVSNYKEYWSYVDAYSHYWRLTVRSKLLMTRKIYDGVRLDIEKCETEGVALGKKTSAYVYMKRIGPQWGILCEISGHSNLMDIPMGEPYSLAGPSDEESSSEISEDYDWGNDQSMKNTTYKYDVEAPLPSYNSEQTHETYTVMPMVKSDQSDVGTPEGSTDEYEDEEEEGEETKVTTKSNNVYRGDQGGTNLDRQEREAERKHEKYMIEAKILLAMISNGLINGRRNE